MLALLKDRHSQTEDVVICAHVKMSGASTIGLEIAHGPRRVSQTNLPMCVKTRCGHPLEFKLMANFTDVLRQALRLAEGNKSAAPNQHKRPKEDKQQSSCEPSHRFLL
jgi:hypothetical protein